MDLDWGAGNIAKTFEILGKTNAFQIGTMMETLKVDTHLSIHQGQGEAQPLPAGTAAPAAAAAASAAFRIGFSPVDSLRRPPILFPPSAYKRLAWNNFADRNGDQILLVTKLLTKLVTKTVLLTKSTGDQILC